MWSRWVDDQFFNAQRTHMLCCDPRPLGRSLICRGIFVLAGMTTGITERSSFGRRNMNPA